MDSKRKGIQVFNSNLQGIITKKMTMKQMVKPCTKQIFKKGKGKVISLQARCFPEGGKRYSSTLP